MLQLGKKNLFLELFGVSYGLLFRQLPDQDTLSNLIDRSWFLWESTWILYFQVKLERSFKSSQIWLADKDFLSLP